MTKIASPDDWIKRLFAAMRNAYGSDFDVRWRPAGDDVTPEQHAADMHAFWSRELAAFIPASFDSPEAARLREAWRWAFDNLPPRAPGLPEFRDLLRKAPRRPERPPELLRDERVSAPTPEDAANITEVLTRVRLGSGSLAWAERLRDRHAAGERLGQGQIDAYKAALDRRDMMTGVE